jgi:hypothetical protein
VQYLEIVGFVGTLQADSSPQISSTLSTMDIQGTGLLDIMSSSWTTAVINQTSNWPCAQNIITVLIAASIDVDKERVNRLTISGRLRFQDCDGENGTRTHAHTCRVAEHRLLGWQYTLTKRGPHKASSVKHRKCWQHFMWQRHGCQRFCCRYVGIRSKRVSFSIVHWQEPK